MRTTHETDPVGARSGVISNGANAILTRVRACKLQWGARDAQYAASKKEGTKRDSSDLTKADMAIRDATSRPDCFVASRR